LTDIAKKLDATRRNFLKSSAAGAAGILVTGSRVREAQAQASVWPATGVLQINPAIDNCRVVYVKDQAMVKRANYGNFSDANKNAIDHVRVKANVERMACALARQTTPAAAWPVIFRKPPTKNWNQVLVAIKVNAVGNYGRCICTGLSADAGPYPPRDSGAGGSGGSGGAGGAAGVAAGAGGAAGGGVGGVLAGAAGAAAQVAATEAGCACGVAVGSVASGVMPIAAAIGGIVARIGRRASKVEKERAEVAEKKRNSPPTCPGADKKRTK
jgi:hypothetical protein